MFELIKAGEQTSYFALPSAIGVYTPDGKNVYLIDSGPHKDNAKKILRVLRENGRVTDIIRTRPKTAIFKSFRRFTLERRQPSCGFNPKNPIKIPRLRVEDFLQ